MRESLSKGREAAARVGDARREATRRALEVLTAAEQERLLPLLERLVAGLADDRAARSRCAGSVIARRAAPTDVRWTSPASSSLPAWTAGPTTHVSEARLISAGAGIVAVSYGLARYGYGLPLPDIRAELQLSSAVLGLIGAGSYVAYLVATSAVSVLATRTGAGAVADTVGLRPAFFAAGGLVALTALLAPREALVAGRLSAASAPAPR